MELPEQPAGTFLPPARDIHADADVQTPAPPPVKLQDAAEEDICRNIHCSCHHS